MSTISFQKYSFTYALLRLSICKFLKVRVEGAVAPTGQFTIGILSCHGPYIFIYDFYNFKNLLEVTVLGKKKGNKRIFNEF